METKESISMECLKTLATEVDVATLIEYQREGRIIEVIRSMEKLAKDAINRINLLGGV